MNCPDCGVRVFADQQFCRGCGAELEIDRQRRADPRKWAFLAVALSLVGILIAMGGKLADSKIIVFAGAFIIVATMLIGTLGVYFQSMRPRRRSMRKEAADEFSKPDFLPRADTTNKLPPISTDSFIPTVTEATTDLLKAPVSRSSEPHRE